MHGSTALLQRARTHCSTADRNQIGIAPDNVDVVHVDARLFGSNHRPRGDMTLAVRGSAGVHNCASLRSYFNLCNFTWRSATRNFYVHAHTYAKLFVAAACTASSLFGAQLFVVGNLQRFVQRNFVIANVVCLTNGGGVRFHEFANEVDASYFGRVFANL